LATAAGLFQRFSFKIIGLKSTRQSLSEIEDPESDMEDFGEVARLIPQNPLATARNP